MPAARALVLAPPPGEWAQRAACKGMAPTDGVTPHPFFQPKGFHLAEQIVALCGACPVQVHCRRYSLRYPVMGVWAGLAERDRRRLRKQRREAS